MGKEGPCGHCGIEQTPLWRNGPPEKPVLCNACGSRWRTRGTLNDYIPKHAMKELAGIGTQTEEDSSSVSSSSKTTTIGPSQLVFENAPRRKRSVLDQYVLTLVGRLSNQLLDFVHEKPEVYLNKPVDGDVLIDQAYAATSTPLGTALGAMLLVPLHEEIAPTSSEFVEIAETTVASDLAGNSGDQGEPPAICEIKFLPNILRLVISCFRHKCMVFERFVVVQLI